jgi:hypothetical protein
MTALRSLGLLLLLLSCTLTTGCNLDTLYLTVRSPSDMNSGRPVRMLVRAVDPQQYVNESYQLVADKVVARDESVLESAVVYPNVPITARVKRPTSKSVGVYFFFTQPGPRWKTLLEIPVPHTTTIKLGQANIESVDQH